MLNERQAIFPSVNDMTRDKEQFLNILESNKLIIFKVCNMYCKDSEDQKDLVQEVIIQLWKSFPKYDEQYKLSTWIYRIALNVSISSLRKSSTRAKHSAPFQEDFLEIAEDNPFSVDENIRLLRKFIDELDDLNKALMILYLDGKSYEEIAEILNLTKSNVGIKISRTKKSWKKQFEKIK